MFDIPCWFCSLSACPDVAHRALMAILVILGCLAVAGLILLIVFICACCANTANANIQTYENFKRLNSIDVRVRALEKACAGKGHNK